MIIPLPCRLYIAAAALVLRDHLVPLPDVVRHHSYYHLLHPVIPRVVVVAFTTRLAHAHNSILGVMGVRPGPVPCHITARVVVEGRPIHARYAVRHHSIRLRDQRILQRIAAAHRVPHPRPIPVPVVIKPSRPCSPTCRRHEPPDVVVGELLISILPVYRPGDADELTAVAGLRTVTHPSREGSISIAQVEQRTAAFHHLLPRQLQPVIAILKAFRRPVAEILAADLPVHPVIDPAQVGIQQGAGIVHPLHGGEPPSVVAPHLHPLAGRISHQRHLTYFVVLIPLLIAYVVDHSYARLQPPEVVIGVAFIPRPVSHRLHPSPARRGVPVVDTHRRRRRDASDVVITHAGKQVQRPICIGGHHSSFVRTGTDGVEVGIGISGRSRLRSGYAGYPALGIAIECAGLSALIDPGQIVQHVIAVVRIPLQISVSRILFGHLHQPT